MQLIAIIEVEFAADILDAGVKEHVLPVKNDDRVDQVLKVPHLMGGDDDCAVFRSEAHDGAPELGLARDVESVGGFIHEDVAGTGCKCKGDVRLLELSCRHGLHLLVKLHIELLHKSLEVVFRIVRPEHTVRVCPVHCL